MRSHRILSAAFVVLALLFSQWAVAMHACGVMTAPTAHAAGDARDPCCPEPAPLNTCERHCAFGEAAVDAAKPVPALDVTLGPALAIPVLASALPHARFDRPLVVSPDPPPAIRFSVLRI